MFYKAIREHRAGHGRGTPFLYENMSSQSVAGNRANPLTRTFYVGKQGEETFAITVVS